VARKRRPQKKRRETEKLRQPISPEGEVLSLGERNLVLLNAIADIFEFKKRPDWEDIKRDISRDQVRELYKVVASLWPPETDFSRILPEPSRKLRALYLGEVDPFSLVRNVVRFSLYADEILIFDPFHNPWFMKKDFDPIINPDQYKSDTLKLLFFARFLEPWIRAGFVTLIPRPDRQNPIFIELAAKRLSNYGPDPSASSDTEETIKAGYLRSLATLSREKLTRTFRQEIPEITDEELEQVVKHFQRMRAEDPLVPDQESEQLGMQLLVQRTGANLETALYVAHLTGAFPYTSQKFRWNELLTAHEDLPDTAQVWSPLTRAFQELDFKFLNSVDPQFAYSLRADGRLESFRVFLRRIWDTVEGEPSIDKIDSLARDFRDELIDEYRKTKAEWEKIARELLMWAGGTGAVALGALGAKAVIPGGLALALPLAGFGLKTVLKLVETRSKRRDFRRKIPMSVFIDLSRHKARIK